MLINKLSLYYEDITTCSPLKVNRRFGGTRRLHLQTRRISQARNEYEADNKESSETSAAFKHSTRCYIPEDRNLHSQFYENLRSCNFYYSFVTYFKILLFRIMFLHSI
jgi:hypothetical protein